jgi:hypothetical protein
LVAKGCVLAVPDPGTEAEARVGKLDPTQEQSILKAF